MEVNNLRSKLEDATIKQMDEVLGFKLYSNNKQLLCVGCVLAYFQQDKEG